jgi:hypothetical protein
MATLATVTFTWQDAYGKTTTRSYQGRDNEPTDGEVQALAADAQALSALSLVKAVVTREVDITGQSDAAEAKSSRQKDGSLVYLKSNLRSSRAGRYTFNLPEFKAALLNADGTVIITDGAIDSWRENFDDGSGIPAVVGDWYVSDQEELIEDEEAVEGFLNKR